MKFNKDQKHKKNNGGSKGEGNSGVNNKRKWNNNNNNNAGGREGDLKKKTEACKGCGKNHIEACLKGKNVCYNCGQEGHIAPNCTNQKKGGCFVCGGVLDHQARNCPKKGKEGGNGGRGNNNTLIISGPTAPSEPTARTFNMTVKDVVASKDVVSSIITVNSIDAYILFDSGATCSIISHEFA